MFVFGVVVAIGFVVDVVVGSEGVVVAIVDVFVS